jgi:Zn-dependent protease with chaperone function
VNRNWLRALAVTAVLAAAAVSAGAWLGGPRGAAVAAAVVVVAVALALVLADRVALAAMRARPVGEIEYPRLFREVRELSKAARLPVPRVYVSPALAPNSFAVGRSRRAAKVCCTEGLLRVLTVDELRAVLAHELAHIRTRDTVATSFCAGLTAVITSLASPAWLRPAWLRSAEPALGAARLGFLGHPGRPAGVGWPVTAEGPGAAGDPGAARAAEFAGGVAVAVRSGLPASGSAASGRAASGPAASGPAGEAEPETAGVMATLVMLVMGPLAALVLQLSLSRRREYRADALGATLAGDPLALARALRKIEAQTVQLPLSLTGPLASASPLMFVNPFSCEGLTRLFSTHPPTGERVFRLEGLAGYPR